MLHSFLLHRRWVSHVHAHSPPSWTSLRPSRSSQGPELSPPCCRAPSRWLAMSPVYEVLVAQLCPTLCDPMDYSLSGSSVPEIAQAGSLEWVTIPFSRGSTDPGTELGAAAWQAGSSLPGPPGEP